MLLRGISATLAIFIILLAFSCGGSSSKEKDAMAQVAYAGKVNAPDFPAGLEWLNTARPISIKDLRGKVVLLDFWTYCCINCMHVIPELKRLEAKYPNELVVIGIHSAKFTTEQGTDNIRQAILRYGLEHPVVNDKDFQVWNSYAANSWPTFMIIDPEGKVVGRHSGEGIFELFDGVIGGIVKDFGAQGKMDRTPLKLALEKDRAPKSLLAYPGKIAADSVGGTLYITDSNHNRVIILSSSDFSVSDVVGEGSEGLEDGSFEEARFNKPQGITVAGDVLYVADTENHAIRKIDLRARKVTTLAGAGRQAREYNVSGKGTDVELNSPWDLLLHNGKLFIAMAGPHQLWTLDLRTLEAKPYAGSGRENIVDGKLLSAALAQPSGITTDGKKLYFADSEVSAVRSADLDPAGSVETIVGEGLFEFGDKDGRGKDVRLQHPIGILYHDRSLYVADTYNNKIKRIDPVTKRSETFIGTGRAGMADGPAKEATLNEPNGLTYAHGKLFITDTNNHLLRLYDFASGRLSTVQFRNSDKLVMRAGKVESAFEGDVVTLDSQTVAAGNGEVRVSVSIPTGYKLNNGAPFYIGYSAEDGSVVAVDSTRREQNIEDPQFPILLPARFSEGTTTLKVDLVVYYCEKEKESLCLVKPLRLVVPVAVNHGPGTSRITLEYAIGATRR